MTETISSDSSSEITTKDKTQNMIEATFSDSSSEIMTKDETQKMTEATTSDNSSSEIKTKDKKLIYRCKKCRRIVASQENIVSHKQGEGWKTWRVENNKLPECTAIFVEPMKWMQTVEEGYVSEKLYCIGCKYRLGSFDWAGMKCSCGSWVNPAFQLVKSRIDECQL